MAFGFSNLTTSNHRGAEQLSLLVPTKCLKHCISFEEAIYAYGKIQ